MMDLSELNGEICIVHFKCVFELGRKFEGE